MEPIKCSSLDISSLRPFRQRCARQIIAFSFLFNLPLNRLLIISVSVKLSLFLLFVTKLIGFFPR